MAPVEGAGELDEMRAGGPGKIVNVVLVEVVGGSPVGIVLGAAQEAGGAQDIIRGHRQVNIPDPVVRKKLGGGVELVAIPTTFLTATLAPPFVDADLGKPLCH